MICRSCQQDLDESHFAMRMTHKKLRHKRCNHCRNAYKRDYYSRHREAQIERVQRYLSKVRKLVREYKARPCFDCGEQYPHYVMDLVAPKLVDQEVFQQVMERRSLPEIRAKIANYDVVCACCNKVRMAEKRRQLKEIQT